jgi:hypothetical protein
MPTELNKPIFAHTPTASRNDTLGTRVRVSSASLCIERVMHTTHDAAQLNRTDDQLVARTAVCDSGVDRARTTTVEIGLAVASAHRFVLAALVLVFEFFGRVFLGG